jgi:hypothetical protein
MLRNILVYGVIAGLVVGISLSVVVIGFSGSHQSNGMVIGYTIMLVGLSTIFVAVKRYRDIDLGGVIGFWKALGLGLGISFVAGILYVAAWDTACAIAGLDFANSYAAAMIAQKKAAGASGAALARFIAEMDEFKVQYANPFFRWPMTFAEIFPVGVLVSFVTAGLLSNSRFLPARHP